MPYDHYDRLTALDATFLEIEKPDVHMHVGAVALFDAAPLTSAEGELDIERIRGAIEAALPSSPRFRQKLGLIPVLGHPVWLDGDRFSLYYHVRHTSLPRPGDIRRLKRLAGRIMSQKLDRGKPLWEMWVVEGVEGGQFAIIIKAHHCMVDGIFGLDLLTRMLRPDKDSTLTPPPKWYPRPSPSGGKLLANEVIRRASLPLSMLRAAGRAVTRPREMIGDLQEALLGFGEVLGAGFEPTSETLLNVHADPVRDVLRPTIHRGRGDRGVLRPSDRVFAYGLKPWTSIGREWRGQLNAVALRRARPTTCEERAWAMHGFWMRCGRRGARASRRRERSPEFIRRSYSGSA